MRNTFTHFCLAIIIGIITWQPLSASHVMGVDITYECTGPCTYRIYHKTYYDCAGSFMAPYIPVTNGNPPPAPDITFGAPGCIPPSALGGWQFVSYEEVTPLCPDFLAPPYDATYPTNCKGSNPSPPINGVVEAVYYQDWNFCSVNCNQYVINWDDCCRNFAITSGASGNGIGSYSTIVDVSLSPCNNSPVFNNKPIPYICAGQPFTFNQGATDIDGDSLSYELGPCSSNTPGSLVTYDATQGYSPTQPLGATWDVQVNPLTGDITMTPNPSGAEVVGVMCILVKEWRNGVLINTLTRDMQITVIPSSNCGTSNPLTGGIQNVTIGNDTVPAFPLNFNEVKICSGVEICFEIPVVPQDTSYDYTLSWNQGISGATFTDAFDPTITNVITGASPVGKFCWTPPPGTDGSYFFVVTVNDDACPVPGFNQFAIIVHVDETLINSDAVAVPIGCNEVQLSAVPVSTIPSPYNNVFTSFTWTGNGNLGFNPNTNDSSFSHLYPSPNTYFYNLSLTDTFGCSLDIPGIVDLTTGVIADAGPDVTICSNYTFSLGTPEIPGQFYTWSPSTHLNDTTIAQPQFTFPNNGSVQTTFNYVLEVTDSICTTYDYTTVAVNPTLQTDVSPASPTVCVGDSVTLTALGNLGAGNTYLWSNGATTQTIKVAPNTSTTYSVVTFNNGCSSNPAFATVNVQLGPSALIAGDFTVCPGESTVLTGSGGVNYWWSAANFTQPTITITDIVGDSIVALVAYDNLGCPGDTTFATLSNYEKPVAQFSAPTVCEGVETAFLDNSTVAANTIVNWLWDFGDGTQNSTNQSPMHTYAGMGLYNVSMIVTTDLGCTDTIVETIDVRPVPTVDFTFTNVCEGDANVFTQAATIGGGGTISSYIWDYGDGSPTGSGVTSSHVYDAFGYFNVTLTVISESNCENSFTKTIFVNPNPIADFEIVSACTDSVVLASTSSAVAGSLDYIQTHEWDFGDDPSDPSNFSNNLRPNHVYTTPGVYTVTLTVTTQNGCTDRIVRDVTVYPTPNAEFAIDMPCENNFTAFSSLSTADPETPITRYYWDLGQGTTSTSPTISNQYINNGGPGTFTITHAVTTSAGCVDTIRRDIDIHPSPRTDFAATTECLNDPTRFTDRTTLAFGDVVDWQWNFGNGATSGVQEPSYTYPQSGNYLVTLTATSDQGCVISRSLQFAVHPLPEIFRIDNDEVCFGDQATLLAVAPADVEIKWFHEREDEQPFHVGNSFVTPALPFTTTYYVMAESEQGCVSERQPAVGNVFDGQDLEINPSANVLELPLAVVDLATASTVGIESWEWNFGDGSLSDQSSPSHEYQYAGIYEVSVNTIDENGCENEASSVLEVKLVTGVILPTAFTPNGDGFNDEYRIGYNNIDNFSIQVFNRWGQMVFESQNPDFEWNGYTGDGQPVQEGVYVFVVKAFDYHGNEINESRTVTVLR